MSRSRVQCPVAPIWEKKFTKLYPLLRLRLRTYYLKLYASKEENSGAVARISFVFISSSEINRRSALTPRLKVRLTKAVEVPTLSGPKVPIPFGPSPNLTQFPFGECSRAFASAEAEDIKPNSALSRGNATEWWLDFGYTVMLAGSFPPDSWWCMVLTSFHLGHELTFLVGRYSLKEFDRNFVLKLVRTLTC